MSPSTPPVSLDSIDLADHDLFRHGFPHDVFTVLREQAPVWRHPDTPGTEVIGGGFWVLSRHADIQAVSRDHARFRSFEGPSLLSEAPERRGHMLLAMDPPDHTRLRALVSKGFTPRMTNRLIDKARGWAGKILDEALERGECEWVHDVAYQLPLHMIGDILGVPESDRTWLFERIDLLLQSTDPRSYLSDEERMDIQLEIYNYAHALGEEKRRNPADDIWTTLTNAEVTQDDGTVTQLSEFELDLFFIVLTIGGSETTRNAISSGLVQMHEHPDQLERLRDDPSLLPSATEEILRWSSPLSYFRRTAVEDVVVGDCLIKADEPVSMWFPSANRDPELFADPFRFDIARERNLHVAFGGGGVHYCLGANLAKREIHVMFEELAARVGGIELLGEPRHSVQGIVNPITVSMSELPVRLTRR